MERKRGLEREDEAGLTFMLEISLFSYMSGFNL